MKSNRINLKDNNILKITNSKINNELFQNVYLYITEHCQLFCKHCYLGERLIHPTLLSLEDYKQLVDIIKQLGTKKLCLLGGEPTLHPNFSEVIKYAKECNFNELILDSNGLNSSLHKILEFNSYDFSYIQISIDGGSSETHDYIRGNGTFKQICNTIKVLTNKDFNIKLICTVNKYNHIR